MSAHPRFFFMMATFSGAIALLLVIWLAKDTLLRLLRWNETAVHISVTSPRPMRVNPAVTSTKRESESFAPKEEFAWSDLAAILNGSDGHSYTIVPLEEKEADGMLKVKCYARCSILGEPESQLIIIGKATIQRDSSQRQTHITRFQQTERYVTYRAFFSVKDDPGNSSSQIIDSAMGSESLNSNDLKKAILNRVW